MSLFDAFYEDYIDFENHIDIKNWDKKIKVLEYYVVPQLNAQEPDVSIIPIGCKNIDFKCINNINVKRIAEDTVNI